MALCRQCQLRVFCLSPRILTPKRAFCSAPQNKSARDSRVASLHDVCSANVMQGRCEA